MNENLLSVEELANYLKTPLSWVYSRTRERGVNAMPKLMVGKYIRFRLPEVLAWLEKRNEKNS
jgi:excisionase family DNA binding protein